MGRGQALTERRRIRVVGSGGAGKSTFAIQLGELTGLPVVHLDRHYWRPGWVPTPEDEWHEVVRSLASADEWIIDGNYGGSFHLSVPRADAIVFFDVHPLLCLWGAVRRRFMHRRRPRRDMADGCEERLSVDFLRWIWNYRKASRPRVVEAMEGADAEVIVVRNRRDARRLLEAVAVATG